MALTRPDATQVITYDVNMTPQSARLLGQLGHVSALHYGSVLPGGDNQLSCTLMVPPTFRTDALDEGRIVRAMRGASIAWDGKLDEPQPGTGGISLTAHGSGTFGTDYDAVYTGTWPGITDNAVNAAIARGLRWTNPGVGSPSGIWYGQAVDSGSQDIATLLNLNCSNGGLTWFVDSSLGQNTLSVFPLPVTPDRILVSNSPQPRTLGGDINTIWIKYMVTADNTTAGTSATYALTSAVNQASVNAHDPMETYIDLSGAGVLTQSAAQAVGNAALQQYVRANFAGPFTIVPGQLMTLGGQPIDIATERAGHVYKLILTDFGYGGEITTAPVSFLGGSYEYDDDTQSAQLSPFMSLATDLPGLLSQISTAMTPITAAS
jgi:hypothetical protein